MALAAFPALASSSLLELEGAASSLILNSGESDNVTITAAKWKEVTDMLDTFNSRPAMGDLDVLDGSSNRYKLVLDRGVSQADYSYFYMLLWEKPTGSGDTTPYMQMTGTIETHRTNDIGVNAVNQFFVSCGHNAKTRATVNTLHQAENAVKQMEVVVVPYQGKDYVALYWDQHSMASFANVHLDATFSWLNAANKDSGRIDGNWLKFIQSHRDLNGGLPLHNETVATNSLALFDSPEVTKIRDLIGRFDVAKAPTFKEYYFTGTVLGNQAISHDIPVRNDDNSGTATAHKVECAMTHHSFASYGTLYEAFVSSRGATILDVKVVAELNSGNGGSWSVSKPDITTLRVSHIPGNYGGGGPYYCKITTFAP